MQKEAAAGRGLNPPLPLLVNTPHNSKRKRTRTGPFLDLQFQPGIVHPFCILCHNYLS
jgi:hypothetical protein